MAKNSTQLEQAKRIMGALVRQPPKPHEEMKLDKSKGKRKNTKPAKKV